MRIQIVMSLVGRLLYIFGIFTLIPFIYGIVFETAYWSFLITTRPFFRFWGDFYPTMVVKVKALAFEMVFS